MRLLFLSNLFPPYDRGGLDQLCHEVTVRLRQRGHTVQVLTSNYGTPPDSSNTDGVTRSLHLQADLFHYRPGDFFLKRPAQERAGAKALRSAIDQLTPDLVVVWGMWNLSRSLPYLAEQWMPDRVAYYIADIWPVSTDIHEEYWRLPANRPLSRLAKRLLQFFALSKLRHEGYPPKLRFRHAVCCSQFIRDMLVDSGRLPPTTGVLYHGIEPDQFLCDPSSRLGTQDGPLRLLYFGRLVPFKGVHTAIEAMGLLKLQGLADRIELTVMGSGHPDYEEELRAMATQLEIGNQVHFTGRVPWKDLLSQLRHSDVLLFTSVGPEAMARTVMEAMAAGLLVIGTQEGGQKEMLFDGENAMAFQAGNPVSLAARIASVLDEPSLRCRLAEAGQQTVLEQFTLKRMVDDVEAWLGAVAN